ncbi:hypothetical protein EDB80DRAFT_218497 [Ilyonectria destructans]|nr:hypothetical protein EDB80DRAFT_218497 [Ilyonectria destructans]
MPTKTKKKKKLLLYMPAFVSCLSVYLFVRPSVRPSACLLVSLSGYLSVCSFPRLAKHCVVALHRLILFIVSAFVETAHTATRARLEHRVLEPPGRASRPDQRKGREPPAPPPSSAAFTVLRETPEPKRHPIIHPQRATEPRSQRAKEPQTPSEVLKGPSLQPPQTPPLDGTRCPQHPSGRSHPPRPQSLLCRPVSGP